jgi:N-acetylneuraminic acid mutarotase
MLTKLTQPFFNIATLMLIVSLTGCSSTPSKENLLTRQESSLKLNTGRYGHVVVNNGEHIFVLGGSGKAGFLSDIEIINPKTNSVVQLKDKLIPRRYHTAVWDQKESIYIFGGMSKSSKGIRPERRIEIFDIPSQQVSIIGEIPGPRRLASSQFVNGKVFYIGGSRKNSPTSTVAVYDIEKGRWKLTANMLTTKNTKTVLNGKHIYTVGGYYQKGMKVLERYNLETKKWQSLDPMPQKLSAHSVVSHGNKIFTFGDYSELDHTHVYDISKQQWQQLGIGYLPSRHSSATILNNKIYVIGGNVASQGSHLDYIQVFSL